MTTSHLLIICVTLLALALIAAAVVLVIRLADQEPEPVELDVVEQLELAVGEVGAVVVLHTADGDIRGTVVAYESGSVGLERAAYLVNGQEQPIGGRVRVPLERVLWSQEV